MRKATIVITPDNKSGHCDLQAGDVSLLEIIDILEALTKGIAQILVDEAEKHVGKDPEAVAKWIDMQRQKPNQN